MTSQLVSTVRAECGALDGVMVAGLALQEEG